MDRNSLNLQENEKDLVFHIRVQYRRNSSMQGSIQWLDGKKTETFRSVLELGNLINDAKEKTYGTGEKVPGLRKWEEKESVS